MLDKLLKLVQGKKTSISAIIGAVTVFTLNRHYIQPDVAELIMSILTAIGIYSNYRTRKM
jgi:hypothetical protein